MQDQVVFNPFQSALQNQRKGQEKLYQLHSGKLLYIAVSYVKDLAVAEDIVIESFYKAFVDIKKCNSENAFGSWIRRIVVNSCIDHLRKHRHLLFVELDPLEEVIEEDWEENEVNNLDILQLLTNMPEGYRVVFNLYFLEEKKHHEIASLLKINIGTSKSQLNKAKNWIRNQIKMQCHEQ